MERINHKEIWRSIKERYSTPEESLEFFLRNRERPELGIVSIQNKKLDLRNEKSASTVIYKELKVVDYGVSQIGFDVISMIMQNTKLHFNEAVELLCKWEDKTADNSIITNPKEKKELEQTKKVAPYSKKYLSKKIEARKENWDTFVQIRNGLLRGCSAQEKKDAVLLFDIGLDGYIPEDSTEMEYRLFIPEYDQKKTAFGSFRYNRSLDTKGLLRKNTQRVLFGSHLMNLFDKKKPIIISEGHSDTIVNNSKRLQTVTSGSSTTPMGQFLPILGGRELHFFPDADQPGMKGVTHKVLEVIKYNQSAEAKDRITFKIFWWGSIYVETKLAETNLDTLSEKELKGVKQSWWFKYKEEIGVDGIITIDVLQKHQEELFKNERIDLSTLPEELFVKNWKLISRDKVKQGFDFIDFHEKYKTSPNYAKFIETYKF